MNNKEYKTNYKRIWDNFEDDLAYYDDILNDLDELYCRDRLNKKQKIQEVL